MDRVGERRFMLAGLVLFTCVTVLGPTSKIELLAVAMPVLGIASGMAFTAALTLVSRSRLRGRGAAIGKFEISFNLGIALISQLGGINADLVGSWSPYILSGGVTLLGSIILLALCQTKHSRIEKGN